MDTNPEIYTTLSEELNNNIITFVDGFGKTIATCDFIKKVPSISAFFTKDKEVKLIKKSSKSKYSSLLNISGDYYVGNELYINSKKSEITLMANHYKIIVPINIFTKREYIIMIMDNPNFDPDSDNYALRGRYKLIIYDIYQQGVYVKYLIKKEEYTSL